MPEFEIGQRVMYLDRPAIIVGVLSSGRLQLSNRNAPEVVNVQHEYTVALLGSEGRMPDRHAMTIPLPETDIIVDVAADASTGEK